MGKSLHPPLTVEAIIDTAERLIVDTDAKECTLRALSRTLGCTPGALNHYFPGGVDEIISAVQVRETDRLHAWINDADNDQEYPGLANLDRLSNAGRLMRRCCAYLDFAGDNPAIYRHLFAHPPIQGATTSELVVIAMIEDTAMIIQAAARAGELNRPTIGWSDAMRLAHLIWVQLHGYADLRISGKDEGQIHQIRLPMLVNLLFLSGFLVAATPAGFEAAARNAAAVSICPEPDPKCQTAGISAA
jgi:AcrR family transcriptional regulator